MKRSRREREGMALLTVLLLVAVMSVVAVAFALMVSSRVNDPRPPVSWVVGPTWRSQRFSASPRSLPSLIRFFRRVRRVSASSLGSSGGISRAAIPLFAIPCGPES